MISRKIFIEIKGNRWLWYTKNIAVSLILNVKIQVSLHYYSFFSKRFCGTIFFWRLNQIIPSIATDNEGLFDEFHSFFNVVSNRFHIQKNSARINEKSALTIGCDLAILNSREKHKPVHELKNHLGNIKGKMHHVNLLDILHSNVASFTFNLFALKLWATSS